MIELSPTLDNKEAEEICVPFRKAQKEQKYTPRGQTGYTVPTLSVFSSKPCSDLVFCALGDWAMWTKSKFAISAFWLPVKQWLSTV